MSKLKLAVALLTVISALLWLQFPDSYANIAFVLFVITYIVLKQMKNDNEFVKLFSKQIESSPKSLKKLETLTADEKEKLAKQFVREIGSDTQCIKLKALKKE